MKSTKQILTDAKVLINRGWCKNTIAQDELGNPVHWLNEKATSFCLVGAVLKSGYGLEKETELAIKAIANDLPNGMIAAFNNSETRTKEEVLSFIDRVVSKLVE